MNILAFGAGNPGGSDLLSSTFSAANLPVYAAGRRGAERPASDLGRADPVGSSYSTYGLGNAYECSAQ